MNAKQMRKVAALECRAGELGHECASWQTGPFEVYVKATNQYGEDMYWKIEKDGVALVIDESEVPA